MAEVLPTGQRTVRAAGLLAILFAGALVACSSEPASSAPELAAPLAASQPAAAAEPSPQLVEEPGSLPVDQVALEFDADKLIAGPGVGTFIPLTDPEFVTAGEATFLDDTDIVLGLSHREEHRAYPLRQIAFHHIVNDAVGGTPYLITY